MILRLLIGLVATYAGFKGHSPYSGVLFVEGMIIANSAIFNLLKKQTLTHL